MCVWWLCYCVSALQSVLTKTSTEDRDSSPMMRINTMSSVRSTLSQNTLRPTNMTAPDQISKIPNVLCHVHSHLPSNHAHQYPVRPVTRWRTQKQPLNAKECSVCLLFCVLIFYFRSCFTIWLLHFGFARDYCLLIAWPFCLLSMSSLNVLDLFSSSF